MKKYLIVSSAASLVLKTYYLQKSYYFQFSKNDFSQYFFKLILIRNSGYTTTTIQNTPFYKTKYNFLKNAYFSSAVVEFNNLHLFICNTGNLNIFRNSIYKFIRLSANSALVSKRSEGIKVITRL